jgi:glycosyltransferase involved in cell wall biosynthesis
MPLISVVIPVYNGEKTIRETIESILNQTFTDFELLVINDGSKDSTLDIASSIIDSRLKIFSYPNAGLSANRNRGISLAACDYISFIDADDLWTVDKLEAQYRALQENSQAAVAYSWTDYIDESGQFIRQGPHCNFNGDVYTRLLLGDFIGNGSNPLIRTHVFAEVGGFDESLTEVEDWDMWLRLASRYHFVAVPSPQVFYRISAKSMSANVWGMEIASLQIIERAFAEAPESIKHLKPTCLGNRYKGLTWRVLEGYPERRKGLTAAKFFWESVIRDRTLLKKQFTWKVLLKIAVWVLLPSQQAQTFINKFKTLPDIHSTLLMHFRMESF